MNLIDLYIHEVTRRLPEKSRKDIALELQSTIQDMLPDDYTEQDVKSVLSKLGDPAILAGNYRDMPMHLIGPRYFDAYMSLLKMIIPIAATVAFIATMAEQIFAYNGEVALVTAIGTIIGKGVASIVNVSIQTFFWFTLVFAIVERVDLGKGESNMKWNRKQWTPDDLKHVPIIPKIKAISKWEVFGSLLGTAIFATVYFNASKLVGVYEKGENGPIFVLPSLNQEVLQSYWPLVAASIVLQVALAIYQLIAAEWTKTVAALNAIAQFAGSIIVIIIIRNPNLFHASFLEYMDHNFGVTFFQNNALIWGIACLLIFFAALNSYQGFRNAMAAPKSM